MAITQNGVTATYEFELPANASDEIVTAVDVENSTITVVPSGRTNAGTVDGEFAIGDVYDGDISGLVGRTVNIGTNSDNKVVKISVNDEDVVTGKMTYIWGDNTDAAASAVSNLKDSYFEDALTGIKYYFSSTNTSNVNYTQVFKAWNGGDYFRTQQTIAGDSVKSNTLPGTHVAGTAAYDYVQLTLNTNGTVAVAMVDPRWTSNILVNDVNDTIVVESEKMTLDVDGYTIVKNGVYVDPEDLEAGDVLYYDAANKFAEVYNDEVSGTISKVTSEKVTIDGVKYNWNGAKHYDSSSKAYVTLDGDADNVNAQKWLNSLSTDDDVTIVLNRGGDIAYITGTEEETASDTKEVYMTNRLGQAYAQDLKHYAQITLNDGSDQSVTVDLSKLTSYAGKDLEEGGAKIHAGGENTAEPWKTTLDFDFTVASGKVDLANVPVGSATATSLKDTSKTDGQFPIGKLVKVTKNTAGVVVGLEVLAATGTMTATSADDNAAQPQLESTDKTITANGKVLGLTSSTRVWVIDKDLKVKKVAFSDYESKTAAGKQKLVSVYADGTKASDIVIDNLEGDAYSDNSTETVAGIVTDVQMAANGSSNEVADITIMQADGVEYTYDGTGKKNGNEPANGNYVVLTLDKDTDDLHDKSSIASFNWIGDADGDGIDDLFTSTLTPGRGSNATTLLPDDGNTVNAKSGALILKRTDKNADKIYEYAPIEIGTINASTNKLNVYYHGVDINGLKVTADIIVVEDVADSAEAGVAVLKPITGVLETTAVIGTWTDNQTGTSDTKSTVGNLQVKGTDGKWTSVQTVTITGNNIYVDSRFKPVGGKEYRLLITAGTLAKYTNAASNTVATAAATKTYLALGTTITKVGTATINAPAITTGSVNAVLDQYENPYKPADGVTDDNITANITDSTGATIRGVAQLNVAPTTGALTFTVKSLKKDAAIATTDVFTFLGCKFTASGGFTRAAYATSVAAATKINGYKAGDMALGALTGYTTGAGTAKVYLSTNTTWDGATTDILVGTVDGTGAITVTGTTAGKLVASTKYYTIVVPDDGLYAAVIDSAGFTSKAPEYDSGAECTVTGLVITVTGALDEFGNAFAFTAGTGPTVDGLTTTVSSVTTAGSCAITVSGTWGNAHASAEDVTSATAAGGFKLTLTTKAGVTTTAVTAGDFTAAGLVAP